jgi:hypothetical protein
MSAPADSTCPTCRRPWHVEKPAGDIKPGERFASRALVLNVAQRHDGFATFADITYRLRTGETRTGTYLTDRLLPVLPSEHQCKAP